MKLLILLCSVFFFLPVQRITFTAKFKTFDFDVRSKKKDHSLPLHKEIKTSPTIATIVFYVDSLLSISDINTRDIKLLSFNPQHIITKDKDAGDRYEYRYSGLRFPKMDKVDINIRYLLKNNIRTDFSLSYQVTDSTGETRKITYAQ